MTREDTLVSVVMPVYNGERFVSRTLASALGQTYRPIEVIVVDDGSTDQTPIIVEAAAGRDSRIRLFRRKNSGVATARNFGIQQARGPLIATLDSDDLWHPEKIARQVGVMQASPPQVGLVYCWSVEIDESDLIIPPISSLKTRKRSTAQGSVTAELARGCFIETASTPLMKRSSIDAVGGYDPALRPQGADDWKLYLALSEICEFAVIPEYLVGYRQASGSISRDVTAMGQSMANVAHWMFERRPDLSTELKRRSIYGINAFMALRALDSDQFFTGLRFLAKAYKADPAGLFDQMTLEFGVRFVARMAGLKRSDLRRRGLRPQVNFEELQAMQQLETGL
jgi:glycosyltransferase involved in cell wall biosynthesis